MDTSKEHQDALTVAISRLVSFQDLPSNEDFHSMMKRIQNYQLQNTKTHMRSAKLHQILISQNVHLQRMISERNFSSKTGKHLKHFKIFYKYVAITRTKTVSRND
jgi:hypothetical protein